MRKVELLVVGSLLVLLLGCTRVQHSAATGGMLGAMTGAIIGHQSGETAAGAGIGAGVGALLGALAQDYTDYVEERTVREYRARHEILPSRRGYRRGRVWVDASHDERVWVPEHYAGGRRVEGRWETKHINGYWENIE